MVDGLPLKVGVVAVIAPPTVFVVAVRLDDALTTGFVITTGAAERVTVIV